MKHGLVVGIVGPTATGKTAVGIELAKSLDGEIISADSMAVYKLMNIGTAKPTPKELSGIRIHLVDVVLPDDDPPQLFDHRGPVGGKLVQIFGKTVGTHQPPSGGIIECRLDSRQNISIRFKCYAIAADYGRNQVLAGTRPSPGPGRRWNRATAGDQASAGTGPSPGPAVARHCHCRPPRRVPSQPLPSLYRRRRPVPRGGTLRWPPLPDIQ